MPPRGRTAGARPRRQAVPGPGPAGPWLDCPPVDTTILLIAGAVYVGMLLGEIPGLALDRTGVALLGAIALVATGRVTPADAWDAVDVTTIALLLGLMVVSAQFRLGGFYGTATARLAAWDAGPERLLAALVGLAGALSALLANDIVCLAMAPVLAAGCARRGLNPVPFLLALAAAANVGSAATLIGNPQNMLVGQALHLSFAGYLLDAAVPAALGLGAVWLVIVVTYRGTWHRPTEVPDTETPGLHRWQTAKGFLVLGALVVAFLVSPWPRETLALIAAGVLLTSRRMASRDILAEVDWHLLVLFAGLFIVNHALLASGTVSTALQHLRGAGVDLACPAWLFGVTAALSNLVSNVPAVMLLLPAAHHRLGGPVLALASTLAGNLLIVGSIANIIVVDQASRLGVRISWRAHARVGIPVTVVTLALAAGWLWLRAGW
jgi:Na+/H+ antiporter NhaD/arsenite permease-like protein